MKKYKKSKFSFIGNGDKKLPKNKMSQTGLYGIYGISRKYTQSAPGLFAGLVFKAH